MGGKTINIINSHHYFCQSWSTLVSLESAFNAEQEHDIIFAVTCTTKEIKNEVNDWGVIQATVETDSDIALGPVGCTGCK